jgi:diadenosine tetraphosphate (Ap4A) HIT family hydrolase
MQDFEMDARLLAETIAVAELPLSAARLMGDANYPWLILVPRRPALAEIIDLDADDRAQLMREISRASEALRAVVSCDKLNVAALGNVVRQLHVHVVARFQGDAAWPGPVWGHGMAVAYEAEDRDSLIVRITTALPS